MQPAYQSLNDLEMNNTESFAFGDQDAQESNLFKEIMQASKKVYLCTYPDCGKIFRYKSETARHSYIHQQDRPHSCPYTDCKKTFKRADALKNHLQIHKGVLPHLCDVPGCGQRFATRAAIRYHKIKHENNRIYKCEYPGCTKSFLTPSQLKQHQNASNVHMRCSMNKGQEEPVEVNVIQDESTPEDVSKMAPKVIDIIEWETKSLNPEGGILEVDNKTEKFEAIYAYLLRENKILKDKMQEREKLVNMYPVPAKETFDFDFDFQQEQLSPQPKEFNTYLNDNEMKFLEFLKGQEDNF